MLARHAVAQASRAARRGLASAAAPAKVGFIGLGNMGGHMAANLLSAGHEVTVFDLNEAAIAKAVAAGAKAAQAAADVAHGAGVVITMLPSSPHVKEVYETGVFDAAEAGALMIDCSTIDPGVSADLAKQALGRGLGMLDAPVSGGVGGAEAGTLTFMVGGTDEHFGAAQGVLGAMGANIVHCGPAGTGQTAKLCNNLILGISMAAVSEGMNLGVKLGMDPKVLAGILNSSTGRCWSSDTYNPCPGVIDGVPSSRGYEGGFGSALMRKDLGLAIDAAEAVGAPLAAGKLAHGLYDEACSKGYERKDFSALYDMFSKAK